MTPEKKRRDNLLAAAALLLFAVVLSLVAVVTVVKVFDIPAPIINPKQEPVIHYFNDDVFNDDIKGNDFNFGPDRYALALAAVEAGEVATAEEWLFADLFQSITPVYATEENPEPLGSDPALAAALAVYMDETMDLPEDLLSFKVSYGGKKVIASELLIGQRADAVHQHFIRYPEQWEKTANEMREYLTGAAISYEVAELGPYTSMMYMRNNGLEGDKPSVVSRRANSRKAGHEFRITTQYGVFRVRLECGYQPFDVHEYWPPPHGEGGDDPEFDINVEIPPTPAPTPTPTPTPTPKPKDPSESSEENPLVSDEAKPNPNNTDNTVSWQDGNRLDNYYPDGYQESEADNRLMQQQAEQYAEDQRRQAEEAYRESTGGNTATTADDPIVVEPDYVIHGGIRDGSSQQTHSDPWDVVPPSAPPNIGAGSAGEDLSGDWFS